MSEGDVAASARRRYSAFLSYPHADRAAAFGLHARLEGYRLPRRLAEQVGAARIRPVFIDRAEMPAAPDLGAAIRGALAESDYLIVVATPHTPTSAWVGREIAAFREMRGPGAILVALLAGDESNAFPPDLLGPGTDATALPLAADFRRAGDGPRLALLKLLAPLIGVDLDNLVHRDERRQRHRTIGWAAAIAALALLLAGAGWSARLARADRDRERIAASQAMERQLDDLRAEIRAGGTLDMSTALTRNIAMFYEAEPGRGSLPEVELGRAKLLQVEAEDLLNAGELDAAAAKARAALTTTAGVLADDPKDTEAIYAHAQSSYWVGLLAWRQGDTPLAANAFARYAELADRLVAADPDNAEWLLEQAYANSNLGTLALREARDNGLAWKYFSAAQRAFRKVERNRPGDPGLLYDIADGEAWLADTLVKADRLDEAEQHRSEQRRILAGLIEQDPTNRNYRTVDLSARLGQAILEGSRKQYASAAAILRSALEDAGTLAAQDPKNEDLAGRRRALELFLARAELDQASQDAAALARAGRLLGDCGKDVRHRSAAELPLFCSLLRARLAARSGRPEEARRLLRQPALAAALQKPALTARWHLDLQESCRQIGLSGLCEAAIKAPGSASG